MSGERLPHGWDALYAETPPWDIGRPQTAFIELAEAGHPHGAVLELSVDSITESHIEATFLDGPVPAWLATLTR